MNIDEMKRIKREHGMTYEIVSEKTGVPLATVQKIFAGVTRSPRYDTMRSLESFFEMLDQRTIEERHAEYMKSHYVPEADEAGDDTSSNVQEHVYEYTAAREDGVKTRWGIPYKEQGSYTAEDYYMIPDEYRVELIEGVIYEISSPDAVHQEIVGDIYTELKQYIHSKGGRCRAYTAPLDVRFIPQRPDNKDTILQPDILVVCPESKGVFRKGRVLGAPDLVIEITSPSSFRRDSMIKLHAYEKAGVREYWIVDPWNRRVVVYDFSSDIYPAIYGFRDKVPVAVYGGDLKIDCAEIDDYINETAEIFGGGYSGSDE